MTSSKRRITSRKSRYLGRDKNGNGPLWGAPRRTLCDNSVESVGEKFRDALARSGIAIEYTPIPKKAGTAEV